MLSPLGQTCPCSPPLQRLGGAEDSGSRLRVWSPGAGVRDAGRCCSASWWREWVLNSRTGPAGCPVGSRKGGGDTCRPSNSGYGCRVPGSVIGSDPLDTHLPPDPYATPGLMYVLCGQFSPSGQLWSHPPAPVQPLAFPRPAGPSLSFNLSVPHLFSHRFLGSSRRPAGLGVSSQLPLSVCVSVTPCRTQPLLSPTSVSHRRRMPCTTSCPSCTPSTRTLRPAWLPSKAAWMPWAPPCRPCPASSPKPYTHFPYPCLPSLAPQTRQPRAPLAGGHPWPLQTAGDGHAHHRTPQSWPLCGRHLHTIQEGRSSCASWSIRSQG